MRLLLLLRVMQQQPQRLLRVGVRKRTMLLSEGWVGLTNGCCRCRA